ncbi:hypothetical protein HPB50_029517 [Hyalomma asiaticum]|nr:hypothetical protein HPB50_029517 [Hyalomma asiaticum]
MHHKSVAYVDVAGAKSGAAVASVVDGQAHTSVPGNEAAHELARALYFRGMWSRPTARTWPNVCKVTRKSLKIIGYFGETPLHSNKPSAWQKKQRGVKTSSPASNRGGAGPRHLDLYAGYGE